MKQEDKPILEIVNRRARFEFHFIQTFEAGIMLTGTEIKSLRKGAANLNDAFCYFKGDELYIKNMFIAEYELGTAFNHEPRRLRKLLLRSGELNKLQRKVKEKGFTIIPYRIYINQRGLAKLEIALAQGKHTYDKRESLKAKDQARDMDRIKKIR
ncbi:MAG: SsrA-binding protein SmpB [Saprospiraceae bacterium]|nr:SsrA-binding protein SmpB [Saprospiraceae bacterium]MCB9312868.1 SsrA-binding protein SmpB [Lewinellaceae bacterium]HRW74340.1 SsrA-binding protein SmpB [Saprospiraceae bacterium]